MYDDPRPGCDGKHQYLTWETANRALSRNRFHPDNRKGYVTVYRCRHCHFWHVGKGHARKRA